MSDLVIRVENLSKAYRIQHKQAHARYKTLQEDLLSLPSKLWSALSGQNGTQETLWALKDICFEVKEGEILGIIGRNGAGKSTLLKILSRITDPTEGRAEIYGRVGSLLEVGTGFHPELTGRENIYLNGTILGMRRHEIERKFDEIVAFAGIEKFLDTPVKRYSSGMYVRLAFAVAAHLEPEVLLVDEVLAVGDAAFQEKCLGKIREVASGGRTVLFVSHNMSAVATLCSNAYWIDAGQIALSGITGVVVDEYLKNINLQDGTLSLAKRRDRIGNGTLQVTMVRLEDLQGSKLQFARCGQGIRFVIGYNTSSEQIISEAVVHLTVVSSRDQRLFCCMSDVIGSPLRNLPRTGNLVCTLAELPLIPGRYDLHLAIHANRQLADKILSAASFQVVEGDFFGTGHLPPEMNGNFLVRNTWQVENDRQFGI